jgi:hypothetical protein
MLHLISKTVSAVEEQLSDGSWPQDKGIRSFIQAATGAHTDIVTEHENVAVKTEACLLISSKRPTHSEQ